MSSPVPPETAATSHPAGDAPGPIIRLREKLAYAMGDIGQSLLLIPLTSFFLFYLTDVVGVGAAVAGSILLIGQLFNGITDWFIGAAIDKTSTRWGKLRPWVLFSSIPMGITFFLAFSIPPALDDTGKVVWSAVTYTLLMAVFYTAANVSYGAMISALTPSPATRITLTTFRFFAALLVSLIASTATLPLISALGDGPGAWSSMGAIYGTILIGTALVVFFGTRERVSATAAHHATASANLPLRRLFATLFRNRYFWAASALFITFQLMNGLAGAAGVYFASDVLGNASIYGLLSVASLLPPLIGIPLMPALMRRFGRRPVVITGFGLMVVGGIIAAVTPQDLTVVMVGLILRGFGLVPIAVAQLPIVADVVDYGEWRHGVRIEGLTFSITSLSYKIGSGLAPALVGWLLGAAGYSAAAGADQPEGVDVVILSAYLYLPIVFAAIALIIMVLFRIERHRPEIERSLCRDLVMEDSTAS